MTDNTASSIKQVNFGIDPVCESVLDKDGIICTAANKAESDALLQRSLEKTSSQQCVHLMIFGLINGYEHHEIQIHITFLYFKLSQSAIDPRPKRKLS